VTSRWVQTMGGEWLRVYDAEDVEHELRRIALAAVPSPRPSVLQTAIARSRAGRAAA
jgi:hypothetical protein